MIVFSLFTYLNRRVLRQAWRSPILNADE